MSTLQTAKSPGGAGQIAKETSDDAIVAQSFDERKHEATLMAQLALQGHAVYRVAQDTRIAHQVPKDSYIVTRWGMVRHCPDIEALDAFARQVGAIN